ncbi:DEKNAAC104705 [Brettanomyces naardenensis]|uniref:Required for respiratory growth protein 9, mitochondrial n=1 Tax=Brettanomyces naardenensis TaxID=13370 RepID=A0A448YRR5_BRENA|nr:DEKNAAC104705 [Brettanomyces naardenensis]
MLKRYIHVLAPAAHAKRPTQWILPDLNKLPGGFRGKVYNKRDWTKYLEKNTKILENEGDDVPQRRLRHPPEDWRNMEHLPQYMRNKYALREKAEHMDLSKTKRLSRSAMDGIRILHNKYPEELTTEKLSEFFKISPVAISKIMKSKWKPTDTEMEKKRVKWEERGKKLIEKQMMDRRLEEFFESKETELKMEIPYFVKQEISDYIHLHGMEDLEEIFNNLNHARVQKQKFKDDKLKDDAEKS